MQQIFCLYLYCLDCQIVIYGFCVYEFHCTQAAGKIQNHIDEKKHQRTVESTVFTFNFFTSFENKIDEIDPSDIVLITQTAKMF